MSESELLVVCEFVMLCILFFLVIKWMFKLYEYEFTFAKDIKTVEVLRSSIKVVRLKYSLVQIPVHVCNTHCPS